MYSQDVIEALKSKIGWSVSTDLPISIDSNIVIADSELKYNGFHGLVSLNNLFATVEESLNTEEEFNKLLEMLRTQCVQFALTSILDKSTAYEDLKSYDSVIKSKSNLFEEVIGLTMVIKVFEIYMASNRSNYIERNSKLSYQSLKIELEGIKNESGYQVAVGIRQMLQKSIRDTQKVIFPLVPTVEYIEFW
jgi:hypothetical protein